MIKGIMLLAFSLFMLVGWVLNVYKFVTDCDFSSPYKCEVVRGVGIFIAPIGSAAGYFNIND